MIIKVNKSTRLYTIVFIAHAGAMLLTALLELSAGLRFGLFLLIGSSCWWQFRHGLPARSCLIKLFEDGTCLCTANGRTLRYTTLIATAFPGLIRFRLEADTLSRHTLLIPEDAIAPEQYRTIRSMIEQRRLPENGHASQSK